jgi:hypothetical protein
MRSVVFVIVLFLSCAGFGVEKTKSDKASSFEVQPVDISKYSDQNVMLGCYCGLSGKLFVNPQFGSGDAFIRINGSIQKLKSDENLKRIKENRTSFSYSENKTKVSLTCDKKIKLLPEPCGPDGCNDISWDCTMDVNFNSESKSFKNLDGNCFC